jgi:tetratricopeptide (TPR) repeat protein
MAGLASCVDSFLEKPDTTGNVDTEMVFSTSKNAESALFYCYRAILNHGWPTGIGITHGNLGNISGELCRGYDWMVILAINNSGLSATGNNGLNENRGTAGADCMNDSWQAIRSCLIVLENIDKVADMSDEMKEYIKGEATALMAYRYMGMFYRYGGIPIVDRVLLPNDNLELPRMPLQDVLDHVLKLCDEAYAKLPDSWANIGAQQNMNVGRITKGAVLAMKARVLMFAARPLFNSATPYGDLGENNNLICFGNADANRWNEAVAANEAVLSWAASNGKSLINTAGKGNRNTFDDAANDYGTACSEPNNSEIILSYRTNQSWFVHWYRYNVDNGWDNDLRGMLGNFLDNYYDKDGKDINWPKVGEAAPRPIADYVNIMDNIEARIKIDCIIPGKPEWSMSNPTRNEWTATGVGKALTNIEGQGAGGNTTSAIFPAATGISQGFANAKFYYKRGGGWWFEAPLFRLAETYLNLAEAYNETGNSAKALENLNMVHNRAGLPNVTVTDKDALRKIIWREKAVELFNENHRYYDVKHWKHPDIGTDLCGGQRRELQFFRLLSGQQLDVDGAENLHQYWMANTYYSMWNNNMYLEPFHQEEINKGVIIQNPGY